MKRVHVIVVILVALTLIMPSFSSLVSAQTVWRDGEQFKVVNSNQIVLFNISNVPITVPKDAKDINVTIHARFRLLHAPDIVNVSAFVCEVNSDNVVFAISSSGSNRAILNTHMEPNRVSSWDVAFCPDDICSNVLDVNITLMNVSPIDGSVNIANAYVVLSNRSSSLEALIPTRDFVRITVVYSRENITFRSKVKNVSSQNSPQDNHGTFWAGIIGVGILLVILIPTIAFLFSGGGPRERGRVAGWSLAGVSLAGVVLFISIVISLILWEVSFNTVFLVALLFAFIIAVLVITLGNNLNRNVRAFLISAFVALVVIGNIAILLMLGIGGQDFFALLFNYSFFGVPLTFLIIWGAGGFWMGIIGTFVVEVFGLGMLISGRTNLIPVGLSILAVFGYAVIFIQIRLKTIFTTQIATLRNTLNNLNNRLVLPGVNRLINMLIIRITQTNNELDTFFDILAGGVITAGSTVLTLAFSPALLESENFDWMDAIQKAIGSIFIFYIGILILSIFLLRADDVLRQVNFQPPRLTIQNAISMLLIVLGLGGGALFSINPNVIQNMSLLVKVWFPFEFSIGISALIYFALSRTRSRAQSLLVSAIILIIGTVGVYILTFWIK